MNSPSSLAQAAESLEPICSDGGQSATSNGTTTASECSPHESQTDSFQPRQFSATCVSSYSPVPLANTEDLRTWLAQVSRASRTASQGSGSEPMTSETCGPQHGTLFATFDQTACSWRMCQESLLDTPQSLSLIWPRWAMWDEQAAYELLTPELGTRETAGGLWPTPKASDGMMGFPRTSGRPIEKVTHLATAAKYWATPSATDYKGSVTSETLQKRMGMTRGVRLPEQVLRDSGLDRGQLNPQWVEWLMGWPIGWTDLKPLETAKFQGWLQQHGDFSPMDEAT